MNKKLKFCLSNTIHKLSIQAAAFSSEYPASS